MHLIILDALNISEFSIKILDFKIGCVAFFKECSRLAVKCLILFKMCCKLCLIILPKKMFQISRIV